MLSLKEFEKSLQSVSQEEILKKKVKGQYVPYIEAILKKARLLPMGRSVEVDVQDPKKASALAMAMRIYLRKMNMDTFAAGTYKTFVFCGKRTAETNGNGKVK